MIIPKKIVFDYCGMLNDHARNAWFKKHIQKIIPNKTFVDVGAGTGILSAYALEAGAKSGYAIEISDEAAVVGKHLTHAMGYKDKVIWLNQDFRNTTIDQVDVVLAEQTGPALFDQRQIDIWQYFNERYNYDYISLPDELAVDLYIYKGDVRRQIDSAIHNDDVLPSGFYKALEKLSIGPDQIAENFISITSASANQCSIENSISLADYSDATLVFVNKIGFQKDYLYLNRSATQNWKFAPRLFVADCSLPIRVFWNPMLSNAEAPADNLYQGYWDFEPIYK
jgi:predicted RNA methylase